MQLDAMVERCKRHEERAAAVYRSYAALSRGEPALCALWTALAREEDQHAHAIVLARGRLEPTAGWRTWLEGWDDALSEVEERLAAAERLGPESTTARQLSAALDVEMSELDALRRVVIAACDAPDAEPPDDHASKLADAARRLSDDPQVRLQAALLMARTRLKKPAS